MLLAFLTTKIFCHSFASRHSKVPGTAHLFAILYLDSTNTECGLTGLHIGELTQQSHHLESQVSNTAAINECQVTPAEYPFDFAR